MDLPALVYPTSEIKGIWDSLRCFLCSSLTLWAFSISLESTAILSLSTRRSTSVSYTHLDVYKRQAQVWQMNRLAKLLVWPWRKISVFRGAQGLFPELYPLFARRGQDPPGSLAYQRTRQRMTHLLGPPLLLLEPERAPGRRLCIHKGYFPPLFPVPVHKVILQQGQRIFPGLLHTHLWPLGLLQGS